MLNSSRSLPHDQKGDCRIYLCNLVTDIIRDAALIPPPFGPDFPANIFPSADGSMDKQAMASEYARTRKEIRSGPMGNMQCSRKSVTGKMRPERSISGE